MRVLWVLETQLILLPTVLTTGSALSYLRPDRSGYITAEEYELITGEELDEFFTKVAR